MSNLIKHSIIKSKRAFYTISGEQFSKGQLFQVILTNDYGGSIIAQSLHHRTDPVAKIKPIPPRFFRLYPKTNHINNFEIITGAI